MQETIPDWAILQLKELYQQHGQWKTMKPLCKSIFKKLGWKPSVQQIYDVVNDISPESKIAPCGKAKRFDSFWGGYRFCGVGKSCECMLSQAINNAQETMISKYGVKSALGHADSRVKARQTMLDRYGVEYSGQSSELREKMEMTNLEKYGHKSVLSDLEVKEKIKETNLEKYGVDNPMKNVHVHEKAKRTMANRHGAKTTLEADALVNKVRSTMVAKYGVEHALQSEGILEKVKQTNRERYGVEYLQQNDVLRDKSKNTMRERYNVDSAMAYPEFKEKAKATSQARYGVPYPTQSEEIKQKTRETNLSRYGTTASSQRHIPPESLAILMDSEKLAALMAEHSLSSAARLLQVHSYTVSTYCRFHDFPKRQSSYETEIEAFLDNLGCEFLMNTRSIIDAGELDFYIPEKKLAIEFNGIYYHSTNFRPDRLYHRKKYEACRDKGIRLLMINEDEWLARSDVIKSKIANVLGFSLRGKGARKLHIQTIEGNVANSFIGQHHIQGPTGSIAYANGAYDGNDLIGVMAFNYQRGTGEIELVRFCSSGMVHAGMFSRMLKHAVKINGYDKILSFADLRYSSGGVYETNGFKLVAEIRPDYRYVLGNKTMHKSSFTKSLIAKRFNMDMSNRTERSAMEELGIPRIYDCGKLKFVWDAKH